MKEWNDSTETYEEIYSVLDDATVNLKVEFKIGDRVSSIDINNVLIKKANDSFIEVIGPNKIKEKQRNHKKI